MQHGAHTRIVVQKTCGDADGRQIARLSRREAPANLAALAEAAGRGFVFHHHVVTRDQAEFVRVDMRIGGKRRAGEFAAIDAMAMGERADLIDLEPNAPAQTASPDHRSAFSVTRFVA